MPLYVTNGKLQLGEPGQLAAQRACCCNEEGDDPEDCVCPDLCLYRIEVVAPLAFGPRPSVPCANDSSNSLTDQTPLDLGPCDAHWTNQGVSVFAGKILQSLAAQVSYLGTNLQSPGATASVTVRCSGEKLIADILWVISVPGAIFDNFFGLPYRLLYRLATVELPSACSRKSKATCENGIASVRGNFLSTPLELTVSNGSPGIGDWGAPYLEDQSGDQTNITDCFEHLQSNFSATFRITQRQSCRIVDCNCSTSLDGLKATFEGKEFTLGTEFPYIETFDDYELVTTHYRDFSGDYIFEKYKVLDTPAGAIGDVQSVKVFCEVDTEVDPQVPRWYAEFVSICRTVEANTNVLAETTRTEIGYFLCSESAGCAGRSENDPVPLGTAQEIEEIPGSPETPSGKDPCTPPARASLTIFEDCG